MSSRFIAVATVAGLLVIGGVIYGVKSRSSGGGEHHQRSHHTEATPRGSASATRLEDVRLSRQGGSTKRPALTSAPAPTPAPGAAEGSAAPAPAAGSAAAPAPAPVAPSERAAAIEVLKQTPHDAAALRTVILSICADKDQAAAIQYYALLPAGEHAAIQRDCMRAGTKLPGEKWLQGKTIETPPELR